MKNNTLPKSFITQASEIIGNTEKGLSGPKIVELFNAYAFDFDVEIPHSTYPPETPNKRTALSENLEAFDTIQQKKIILELCDHPNICKQSDVKRLKKRLLEKYNIPVPTAIDTDENEFLLKDFTKIEKKLGNLESDLQSVMKQRINEINICLNNNLPLASIFLTASTLEGILFDLIKENPTQFTICQSTPKIKGVTVEFSKWKLNHMLDTASELGYISKDSYKWGKELKDIRNFIHPREQVKNNYNPNMRSAKIAFQVLMSVIEDIDNYKE